MVISRFRNICKSKKNTLITYVIAFLVLFFVSSCSKEYYHNKYIDILCSNYWVVNNYIDNSENIAIETKNIIYKFYDCGKLEKEYENGFTAKATWELFEDNEYLRMGDNIFKLKTLNNRLLSLRHGNINIFFVSL